MNLIPPTYQHVCLLISECWRPSNMHYAQVSWTTQTAPRWPLGGLSKEKISVHLASCMQAGITKRHDPNPPFSQCVRDRPLSWPQFPAPDSPHFWLDAMDVYQLTLNWAGDKGTIRPDDAHESLDQCDKEACTLHICLQHCKKKKTKEDIYLIKWRRQISNIINSISICLGSSHFFIHYFILLIALGRH